MSIILRRFWAMIKSFKRYFIISLWLNALIFGGDSVQGGPFATFFQDPEIQSILHVRGINLPGINFYPEDYSLIQNISQKLLAYGIDSQEGASGFYYEPPSGWKVCNDAIVCPFFFSFLFGRQQVSYHREYFLFFLQDAEMQADHPVSVVSILQFLSDFSSHYPLDAREISLSPTKANLRILLYSGEFDLNCNTLGTLHTLEANLWRNR